jgi:hypothetical protein
LTGEEAVKKSRFSEEQMVKILREADRAPVGEVAKRHGVSEQTIYAWRKRFGALEAADVRLLRQARSWRVSHRRAPACDPLQDARVDRVQGLVRPQKREREEPGATKMAVRQGSGFGGSEPSLWCRLVPSVVPRAS